MGILLALVLSAHITISPGLAEVLPPVDALESGLQRHVARSYGRFIDVSFDPGDATAAPAGGEDVVVALGRQGDTITVSTDLTRGTQTRSLSSTVPLGATASLVPTIAADIAFLHFSFAGFAAVPLSPPPPMTADIQTDTLATLTSWDPAELEPIGLAAAGDGVIVCFPHRYLTLGPSFRIAEETVRDMNQQASGREPVQLSGVVTGARGELILLSEREGTIVRANPRLGTRQALAAHGLPALGARMLGTDSVAVLSNAPGAVGLEVFPLSGGAPRLVPIHASYLSAFTRDREGNFWAWDAGERRVRIVTSGGAEVYSIRPLVGASTMQLPQELEVFDDGTFLLGGSGEVWKFQNNGMPVWRLDRLPGPPAERLPSVFALAANGADGSFVLMDAPSRRLMMFSPAPTGAPAPALARAGTGGSPAEREAGKIAVLREKTSRYADLADSFERDLLFDRADTAYARAAESARELTDESPSDQEGALILQRVVTSRQEMRAAFTRKPDVSIVAAAGEIRRTVPCRDALVVKIGIRNAGAVAVTDLRAHVSAPSVSDSPALSILEKLAPGAEGNVEVPLDISGDTAFPEPPGGNLHIAILVTYQRGREGVSVRGSLDIEVASVGPRPSSVDLMGCGVAAGDQMVAGLADDLLVGPSAGDGRQDPLADFAAVLDSLGGLRSRAARAIGSAGAPAATDGADGVRETLRGLSPTERGWTLVTLCAAATLGLPVGIVSWPDRAFALVDTGIARTDAMSQVPGLSQYAAVLGALARGPTLCVPLSGTMSPGPDGAAGWALADALRDCMRRDIKGAKVWWRDSASAAAVSPSIPMPIPFPLPAIRVTPSRDTLRAEIIRSLEQYK